MKQERRRIPRFAFVASAEVSEENDGARLKTRVSDLSFFGCYVDTINPFPHGTPVQVKIFTETHSFEAPATVVFAHAHLGMGLAFGEVKLNSLEVLQKWLPAVQASRG
jgi:hypothetical protein